MLHVFERLTLRFSFAQAREHLCGALTGLDESILAGGVFRVEKGSDPLRSVRPWRILWRAGTGEFAGEIAAHIDRGTRRAMLELHGDFAPCSGVPIETASAAAVQTARMLLNAIAAEMLERYSDETVRFM